MNTASKALVDAMWCAAGHTPQSLLVRTGSSCTCLPMQNLSKPLSSGICMYAFETSPFSSRNISILPCPSSLVTGSIVILLSFVFTVASLMIGPAILCHPFLPRSLTVLLRGDFGSVNA